MTGYTVLRALHSYWRWAVIVSAIVLLVRVLRRGEWTKADDRASLFYVAALDLQLLLGLVLYFGFSPYFDAFKAGMKVAMHDRNTRFFSVEHQTAMLLVVVAAHWARIKAKRAVDAAAKRKALLVALVVLGLALAFAMPWPWRAQTGRPLFRTDW